LPSFPQEFTAAPEDAGKRLDHYLVGKLPDVSRARIQQLIAAGQIRVSGAAAKPSLRLRGGEEISLLGPPQPPPLRAQPEEIPLDVVYENQDLAVINKPAGMMVHAGAGATESVRNRGTLVNALLHRFGALSEVGGQLRPGIVHRLDRNTSGLIIVAKNDFAHQRLARQFSERQVHKRYVALVHGWMKQDRGTISSSISRDRLRRTRMTTRGRGREAVTHYSVRERIASRIGKFSLLDITIDTGRTHQIRVHLASLGHPIMGDTLYGAARTVKSGPESLSLERTFLHAAAIEFSDPRTGAPLAFARPLPPELESSLSRLKSAG
jgi:23S rRNA pseudouridine1911/1915/1917 synthase